MNKIIVILLSILFIQGLIFLYVKLIHENNLPSLTLSQNLVDTPTEPTIEPLTFQAPQVLPESSEYTTWNKEMIAKLNQEIQLFNLEMQKIVNESIPLPKVTEVEQPIKKPIKLAQKPIPKAKPKSSLTLKVTQFAKKKLGAKYVWGATGPNKFDCSGFTREVYRSTTGIKIPRVSRDQAKVGTYVKFSELKRGDMVFFDTEKKYTGKVNHVGIYLSNNNFIHASSGGKKVIITNFKTKPFYKKRFLWGRRIVQNQS